MPSAEALEEARRALRLTDEQLGRCHEIQQYMGLQRALAALEPAGAGGKGKGKERVGEGGGDKEKEELVRAFRLGVKRRLNKKHKEELDNLLVVPPADDEEEANHAGGGQAAAAAAAANNLLAKKAAATEARKARLDKLYQELVAEYDVLAARLQATE